MTDQNDQPIQADGESIRRVEPPFMTWEEVKSGKRGQQYLPGLAPIPSVAERVFVKLARDWYCLATAPSDSHPYPGHPGRQFELISLSCLLLAIDYGNCLSSVAKEIASVNKETAARRDEFCWLFQDLPWHLCESLIKASEHSVPMGVDLLIHNVTHHNAACREWVLEIAWIARKRLPTAKATARLLENLEWGQSPAESAGVAASLFETEDEFWKTAREFAPPGKGTNYKSEMQRVELHTVRELQASFWRLESNCLRELFSRTVALIESRPAS